MQARNDHEAGEQVHLASREVTRNIQIILAQAISAGQEVSARVSWKARGSSRVLIEFDLRANVAQSSSLSEKSASHQTFGPKPRNGRYFRWKPPRFAWCDALFGIPLDFSDSLLATEIRSHREKIKGFSVCSLLANAVCGTIAYGELTVGAK
jgi:hypothetical protein